jgi:hypothetical protein
MIRRFCGKENVVPRYGNIKEKTRDTDSCGIDVVATMVAIDQE